jgi:hypothetical protein
LEGRDEGPRMRLRPPDQERAGGKREVLALMGRSGSGSGEAVGGGMGGVFMGGE